MNVDRSAVCLTGVDLALAAVEVLRSRIAGGSPIGAGDPDLERLTSAELAQIAANRLNLLAAVLREEN